MKLSCNLLQLSIILFSSVVALIHGTATLDYSCTTCGDCEIKDLGDCCGHYYPECFYRGFNLDTEAVDQWCQDHHAGNGLCEFRSINTCACVEGKCVSKWSFAEGVEKCEEEPTLKDANQEHESTAIKGRSVTFAMAWLILSCFI